MGAAAWTWARFDLSIDRASDKPVSHNVSWLDFSHMLTFGNAARHLCSERPDLWPNALLQLACFIGRNKPFIDPALDVDAWRVAERDSFLASSTDSLLDHGIPEPIISCHRVKVLAALRDELEASPDAVWAEDMLLAVNRFLNTPMTRHHSLRTARQSLAFVAAEG
jgi:hypothetical protein